jgi:hypothetical protein
MPREPVLGGSSYRKQAVPICGVLSGQRIFNAYIGGIDSFIS